MLTLEMWAMLSDTSMLISAVSPDRVARIRIERCKRSQTVSHSVDATVRPLGMNGGVLSLGS